MQSRSEHTHVSGPLPTIYVTALRIGGAASGRLDWYWRLPRPLRRAADARTRDHMENTYGACIWSITAEQARAVYRWARAEHA
jgi:hypothetical protein